MQLLVSLCNLPQPQTSGLLLIDSNAPGPQRIAIGAPEFGVQGSVGLWVTSDAIYNAWSGTDGHSYLTVLDKPTLKVLECVRLEGAKDVHSICVADDWIYFVSTGTDEIKRAPTNRLGGQLEAVWEASAARSDTHHLNAVLPVGGRLLCSAFGPKAGERWSTALDGYVLDLTSGEMLMKGIEHPHSLALGPTDLYVAESRRERVIGLTQGRLVGVEGYARGLCFTSDLCVVGVSKGRARSRSLGTIENSADPGELSVVMGLAYFNRPEPNSEATWIANVDLSEYGPEIYDVAAIMP